MPRGLNEKQSTELCETVGRMLVRELESHAVKGKVRKLVADYVKKNKINANPTALSEELHWHVDVMLKK